MPNKKNIKTGKASKESIPGRRDQRELLNQKTNLSHEGDAEFTKARQKPKGD